MDQNAVGVKPQSQFRRADQITPDRRAEPPAPSSGRKARRCITRLPQDRMYLAGDIARDSRDVVASAYAATSSP